MLHVFYSASRGIKPSSAQEVKHNCCSFERLFKEKNCVFLFGISFFISEIYIFCVMQMRKVMTSYVVPVKEYYTQSRISRGILKRCSSNLAPDMYITKETK